MLILSNTIKTSQIVLHVKLINWTDLLHYLSFMHFIPSWIFIRIIVLDQLVNNERYCVTFYWTATYNRTLSYDVKVFHTQLVATYNGKLKQQRFKDNVQNYKLQGTYYTVKFVVSLPVHCGLLYDRYKHFKSTIMSDPLVNLIFFFAIIWNKVPVNYSSNSGGLY